MTEETERREDTVVHVDPEPAEGTEAPEAPLVYCSQCGVEMAAGQRFCADCGWDAENPEKPPPGAKPSSPRELGPISTQNRLTVLLLCVLLGPFGVHRFYVGRTLSGFVWLVTLGFLGVGVLYDLVLIATGEFRDSLERRVWHWS